MRTSKSLIEENLKVRFGWAEVNRCQEANNQEGVVEALKAIIAINRNSLSAHNKLGAAYRKLFVETGDIGYLKTAVIVYEEALGIRINPVSLVGLAALYCDMRQLGMAAACCDLMIRYFGEDSYILKVQSRIASMNGESELAVVLFKQAQILRHSERIGLEMTESGFKVHGYNEIVPPCALKPSQANQNTNNVRYKNSGQPGEIANKCFEEDCQNYGYPLEEDYLEYEEYINEEMNALQEELYSEENYNYYLGDDDWEEIRDRDEY